MFRSRWKAVGSWMTQMRSTRYPYNTTSHITIVGEQDHRGRRRIRVIQDPDGEAKQTAAYQSAVLWREGLT